VAGLELEAKGVVKRYGAVLANDHVDLAVETGEIHAIMGENGAGKSTLMSILYGLQRPDEGRVLLRGEEVHFRSPLDAIARGMGMVHQAFKLFNSLTAWENIVYAREPRRGLFLDQRQARRSVAALAERHHLNVDPDAIVERLSVGERQRIEILKALYRDARTLILDEPTAVLTPQERDRLFAVMRQLAAEGRTILFVTHKLHEVMAVTDRVTVLRDGRVVSRAKTNETSPAEIIRAMTGRSVTLKVDKGPTAVGAPILEAINVTVETPGSRPTVEKVNLVVRAGEIVGIAGVAGNGQSELVEVLVGLRPLDSGAIRIAGRDVASADVAERRVAGIAYIPEDRVAVGAALKASAADNLAMGFQHFPPIARGAAIDLRALSERARGLIARFGVKIPSERSPVSSLSGGNLQKVVVARELSHEAPALIAEQPTRGLDVGATEFIHAQLVAERDKGRAVLLVSAELAEILALSDRVLVMYEGRILADIGGDEANEDRLGLLMAGRAPAAA
jgi:simple sugar transport system ATP-binding protein